MPTYTAATQSEIDMVLAQFYSEHSVPAGFAVDFTWPEKVRRIAGDGGAAAWPVWFSDFVPGPNQLVVGDATGQPLKRDIPAVVGRVVIPWRSNRYYDYATEFPGGQTSAALVANRLYAQPLYVPETRAINQIGIWIATGAAAGTKARLMLFNPTATDALPGTLLLDCGEVPVDAAGNQLLTLTPLTLNGPALYYTALWTAGTPTVSGYTNLWSGQGFTALNSSVTPGPFMDLAYGAAPAAFALTDYGTIVPRVAVRAV